MVFYVSRWSLTSPACYDELCRTRVKRTRAIHNGEVGYIAVEAEPVGNIADFRNRVHTSMMERGDMAIKEREMRAEILFDFIENFFNTNNEKVRVHTKDEPDRKMDYYEKVTASFPDSAKIYAVQPAETSPDDVLQEDETVTAAPDVSGNAPQEDEDAVSAEAGNTETEKAEDSSVDMDALLRLGEKGNTTAQFTLGGMYYFSKGVEKDDGQAEYWLAKAAGNGDSHAAKLLKMLKKPRISPTKNEPAEPVKNEPAEPGRIPTELILEAVRKFWKYGKT